MKFSNAILNPIIKRKLATALFIGLSVAAFATLGDGSKKSTSVKNRNLLSSRSADLNYKTFSLKSGYTFRGNSFLNTTEKSRYIMLNTVMTYQKGNTTYILPLKKKLLLGKVTFQPTVAPR
ncbi:MAG TPA: hypothetical protein VM010_02250 [Chitinophagaceae bacterium]|nr:hypothetical protein [Chitinophagaceae bacterium]